MSFFKKIVLYFIGNFSGKILVVLLIPIYALYVEKGDLGAFDYMQTIMNVGITVCYIAIWESVLRYILAESKETKTHYTNNIIFFSLSVSIFVFLTSLIVTKICEFSIGVSVCNALMCSFYGLAQIWQYFSRAYEQNKLYVVSGIYGTIVNFLFIVILICKYKTGLFGLLLSYAMGRIIIFIYLEGKLRLINYLKWSDFNWDELVGIIKFSFPLAVNSIAGWLISGIGTLIVTNRLGVEINGLYAFSNKFSALIISIGGIFIMALIEESIIELKKSDSFDRLKNYFQILSDLFMSLVVLLLPVIGIFYKLISSTAYLETKSYVPYVLLYALFSVLASAIGAFFQAFDMTKYQFTTTVAGAICTFVLSWLGIGKFGIFAVLVGQVSGAFIMMISRLYIVNRKIYIDFDVAHLIVFIILYIFSAFLFCNFTGFFLFIFLLLGVGGVIFCLNKKWISTMVLIFKQHR